MALQFVGTIGISISIDGDAITFHIVGSSPTRTITGTDGIVWHTTDEGEVFEVTFPSAGVMQEYAGPHGFNLPGIYRNVLPDDVVIPYLRTFVDDPDEVYGG